MKFISYIAASCLLASCATARLEKLAEAATPYNSETADKMMPRPVEGADALKVTHRIEVKTSAGAIVIGLYGDAAPKTVSNFLSYVKAGYYEGMIFHRVIPGFMIQGGGYDEDMIKAESGNPIALELIPGIRHVAGTVSMARTADPASATSQFFICVAETEQLNGEYAAFGMVEEGIDTAIAMSQMNTHSVETETAVMDDVPVSPIVIHSVTLLQ